MLKVVYVAFLILSLGVYALAAMGIRIDMATSVVEKINVLHLLLLYIAIGLYIVSSLKRIPHVGIACMTLLLISSYTGVLVETWRFVGVETKLIPPFVFVITCAQGYRALCDHYSAYEISVPLATAFVVACWALYKLVSTMRKGGYGARAS